ncbi:unnamed protein product [Schistocephalus solidus]|uniref:Secreted protein n=1 Tax=Schistocephalus solidus TaxID=70667 RepID=A0A3P7D366_SCHSO|nr:unnamed protein product [Schistocephalus solidus]
MLSELVSLLMLGLGASGWLGAEPTLRSNPMLPLTGSLKWIRTMTWICHLPYQKHSGPCNRFPAVKHQDPKQSNGKSTSTASSGSWRNSQHSSRRCDTKYKFLRISKTRPSSISTSGKGTANSLITTEAARC